MSDRNNNHFNNDELKRLIQQHPELAAKAKQIYREGKEIHPVASYGYWKKYRDFFKDLFTVDSRKLYGDNPVKEEVKSHSQAVGSIGTSANLLNIATAFPLIFIAFGDIALIGLPLALGTSMILLKSSNKCVEVAAANKPGNQFWSEVGLTGVVAINLIQSLFAGVGTQLVLDKPGISNRFAEELVYAQVVQPLEAKVEASQFDPKTIESKQKCEQLETELANTPLNTAKSDRLHTQAYGSYQDSQLPLEQRSYYSLPIHQQPYCPRAKEEQQQLVETLAAAKNELQETTTEIANSDSLIYLREQKPEIYQQHINENGELKSGTTATKVAAEIFFENIRNGNWTTLGFSAYIFSLSIITSAISVFLTASHAKRKDVQMSWNLEVARAEKAYTAKKRAELRQQAETKESPDIADYIPYSYTDVITSTNGNGNGKHH